MDVSPLNLGMIAAYYYINYTTIGKSVNEILCDLTVIFDRNLKEIVFFLVQFKNGTSVLSQQSSQFKVKQH